MTSQGDADRSGVLPAEDLRAWFAPSARQLLVARAMLAAAPGAYLVVVPLALPGKDPGIWISGQRVEHPGGYWLARTPSPDGVEAYRVAHDEAEAAADRHLGRRPGVAAYAVIYSDHWSASEGLRRRPPAPIAHHAQVVLYDLGHDYWRTPQHGTLIRCHSGHQGRETPFRVHFTGPDGAGPSASLIAQPTVIAEHPGSPAESVTLTEGQRIEVHGYVFEIRDDKPQHDPQLYLV